MAVGWITFHITDRCNLDCHHCLRDPEKRPKDLPVELIRRALGEAREKYGADHTAFSGGEPTLHPDFGGVVDAAVDQGFSWHMVSNGHNFPYVLDLLRARPERLSGLTSVSFSLDGATAAVHDSIREKGSYEEVLRAASVCMAAGIKFVFQMAVHAKNEHEIEALGLLASQLGATRLSFTLTQPTGTHHDKDHYLSPAAFRRVLARIERLRDALTLPVSVPEGWYTEQPFHVCQPFASQQLHIDIEGRVNLCCQHSGIPGDGSGRDIAGDLNEMTLTQAHRKFVGLVHDAQVAKLDAIERGEIGEWDHFACNWCMKHFGKPHWVDDGVGGPPAARQRWRGTWEKRNRLQIVS